MIRTRDLLTPSEARWTKLRHSPSLLILPGPAVNKVPYMPPVNPECPGYRYLRFSGPDPAADFQYLHGSQDMVAVLLPSGAFT